MIHPYVQSKLPELTRIFKDHRVQKAYLFGSAVTGAFNEDSDVDILIDPIDMHTEPDPVERGEMLWDLYYALHKCLNRKVDMVTRNSLTNKYFIQELERTAIPIYG